MADISISSGIEDQVNRFKNAGDGLVGKGLSLDSGSSLPTCVNYRKRGAQIEAVIAALSSLVTSDSKQISTFIENMKAQDNA